MGEESSVSVALCDSSVRLCVPVFSLFNSSCQAITTKPIKMASMRLTPGAATLACSRVGRMANTAVNPHPNATPPSNRGGSVKPSSLARPTIRPAPSALLATISPSSSAITDRPRMRETAVITPAFHRFSRTRLNTTAQMLSSGRPKIIKNWGRRVGRTSVGSKYGAPACERKPRKKGR